MIAGSSETKPSGTPGAIARRFLAKTSLAVVSTVLALAAVEIGMRLLWPFDGYHPLLPLRPQVRMEVALGSQHGTYTTNRLGLRGDEPPWNWRSYVTVVAIGGSTTQCLFLDDAETWPHVLQETLRADVPNVWVGNGGIDGHSTRGHLVFVREILPKIRPDFAVVLVGVNDLLNSILGWRDARGNPQELHRQARSIVEGSRLVELLESAKLRWIDQPPAVAYLFPGSPLPPLKIPTALPADLSSMLPTLAEYGENLSEIASRANAIGVRVVFLTQPMLFDASPRWDGVDASVCWVTRKRKSVSAAAVWKLLEVFNRRLLEVCVEQHLDCFDLAARVPHSEAYFYDWVHLNPAGARLVGEEVAGFLRDKVRDVAESRREPAAPARVP